MDFRKPDNRYLNVPKGILPMSLRTPRNTRTMAQISQDAVNRLVRIVIGAGIVALVSWLYVVAHFIIKFW